MKGGFNSNDKSTIYGEFKLSEQLSQNIAEIKQRVDHLTESLEEVTYQHKMALQKIKAVEKKLVIKSKEIPVLKGLLREQMKKAFWKNVESESFVRSSATLEQLCKLSEKHRKENCEQLRHSLLNEDNDYNTIFSLRNAQTL